MLARARLTRKYQITIPSQVRRHLGLQAGDSVYLALDGDQVVLRAVADSWTESYRGLGAELWREAGGALAVEQERDAWDARPPVSYELAEAGGDRGDWPSTPPLYGVDTMLFVYHLEGSSEFGEAAERCLRLAEAGRCHLVASVLTLLEVLVLPRRHGRSDLCQSYRELLTTFPHLRLLPVTAEIAELAAFLRADHGLRTPDSLHLATALASGADAFLTEDSRLRDLPGLPVVALRDALPGQE